MIPVIDSLAMLGRKDAVWLVDIWGVLHDGIRAHPGAVAAVQAFRADGGIAVLISNSPRPSPGVAAQMGDFGVPMDIADAIVTSGDLTMAMLRERGGQRGHHIGPARDVGIFPGAPITLVPLESADFIVLTGLVDDETETLADYLPLLAQARERDLPMICANPDLWVERGNRLIPCAGLIAEDYVRQGGTVAFAGKPHPPIYARALALAAEKLGRAPALSEVLAIGDGLATDIAGAQAQGIDSVYIASAVSAGAREALAAGTLCDLLGDCRPLAVMTDLAP